MKKLILIFTVLALLILTGGYFYLTDCGACITPRDYAFLDKIKEHLKKPGDFVKVADIHPGEWKEVCSSSSGMIANFSASMSPDGKTSQNRKVINNTATTIGDTYDESAVVFHSGNKLPGKWSGYDTIEVYRMTPDKMVFQGSKGCLDRDEAYFLYVLSRNERFSEESLKVINIAPDYFEVGIVTKKEIERGN